MGINLAITFIPQDEPLWIAHAISLCEKYVKEDFYYTLLGDNVLIGDISKASINYQKPWILTAQEANPIQ